jgi:YD repeat-containing protein
VVEGIGKKVGRGSYRTIRRIRCYGQCEKVVDGLRYSGSIADSLGTEFIRVVSETNALGDTIHYEYDILGRLLVRTDQNGHDTNYTYRTDGTLESIKYPDGGETNQLGHTTKYAYNAFGTVRAVTDPYGYLIENKYDRAGNLRSQKDQRGSVSLLMYDANNRLSEKRTPLELDDSGNVVYAVEKYLYDAVGNLTRKSLTGSKSASFARVSDYNYYDNDKLQ